MSDPDAVGTNVTRAISEDVLRAFDDDVSQAMATFSQVGAAVALVEGNQIVFNRGYGTRDIASEEPVTPHTRFRIGSNTKSMTSLLLARYVDDGLLSWNTRAVDVWPEFGAPHDELTSSLRIADLLGMGSGVAESPTIEFFVSGGGLGALDLLRSIRYLPVIAPPDTAYYYNNTLNAAAAHLGMIASGAGPDELEDRYTAELRRVVFDPIGMADADVVADPRPLGPDVATGHAPTCSAAGSVHQHRRLRTGRPWRARRHALPDHSAAGGVTPEGSASRRPRTSIGRTSPASRFPRTL